VAVILIVLSCLAFLCWRLDSSGTASCIYIATMLATSSSRNAPTTGTATATASFAVAVTVAVAVALAVALLAILVVILTEEILVQIRIGRQQWN
jgi:hypothetical protein